MINSVTQIIKHHRSFLMGCAMLSIMLYHQPWCKEGVFRFFELTGDLGVELFLFVSGWGIYHSLCKNDLRTYFKNRILRLMPTCVLIGVTQVLIEKTGFIGGSSNSMAHLLMCLGLFKWYIYAIICYYTLAPLLYRYLIDWKRMLLVSAIALSIIFYCKSIRFLDDAGSVFLTTLPIIIYRFPAFLFGFWFARKPFSLTVRTVGAGILAYVGVLVSAYHVIDTSYNAVMSYILFSLSIPVLVYLSNGLIQPISKTGFYNAIVWIGSCSLEIYLWHDFWFRGFSSGIVTDIDLLQILFSLLLTLFFVWTTKWLVANIVRK